MRFASLGSGSKGNATLVEWRDTCLLVDCGFSIKETELRLARLERRPEQLTAILVTHEHGDHMRGVMPLARRYNIPVMMTAGTAKAAGHEARTGITLVADMQELSIGQLRVEPVAVPHDAREPVQFVFRSPENCLGVLTDLGSISPHVVDRYRECDGLLLEANHDTGMLANGPYPYPLKRRVGGDWGHLNNTQSADLLGAINARRLQTLVLGHISRKNNHPDRVRAAVGALTAHVPTVLYACQDAGFPWQVLG